MRRTGLLIGGWALATALALVLGLQSVSAISDSVTGRPRKTLSPSSVRAALDRSVSSDDSSSSESTESSESQNGTQSSSGSNGSASSDSNGPRGGDASSSAASSAAPSDDQLSSGGDGDSGSSNSQAFPVPQDQTFDSVGGTVTVRFESGQAHLLLVTAHDGFSCEDDSNSSSVDVRCVNPDHESRIRAFWNDGPQHTVEETS